MKKVTQEEFYKFIGPQNVVGSCVGDSPYDYHVKTRSGELVAKIECSHAPGTVWPKIETHFIKES
tara:strand:+ start:1197 stop:1391 length:195 start_codon:yes stop_codon:yes gene_type:complete